MLQKSEEEQASAAGMATIEAKSKFVEIGIQVLGCNRSLVGAEQPAFEQRHNAMHPRHRNVCRIAALGNIDRVVPVSFFGKAVVTSPPVSAYLRVLLNRGADKRNEAGA